MPPNPETALPTYDGLTVRDRLAMAALQGLLAGRGAAGLWTPEDIATGAYEFADAMLVASVKSVDCG